MNGGRDGGRGRDEEKGVEINSYLIICDSLIN